MFLSILGDVPGLYQSYTFGGSPAFQLTSSLNIMAILKNYPSAWIDEHKSGTEIFSLFRSLLLLVFQVP